MASIDSAAAIEQEWRKNGCAQHGLGGTDYGETGMSADAAIEAEIREDERNRIAAAIEEHHETISTFAGDKDLAVQLVAFLIRHRSTNAALSSAAAEIHGVEAQ
jgi:hypothetical protein